MTKRRCWLAWRCLAVLAGQALPHYAALAEPQALTQAKIVAAAYDQASHRGTLYLVENARLRAIFSDPQVLTLPVFSPAGDKIAFNRVVDEDVANAELVVIDLAGRVLSSVLINENPSKPGNNYEETRNIVSVEWMGEDRVALTGIFNPTVNIGYIIALRPSSLANPTTYGSDPRDGMFYDEGPSSLSPGGSHVVSVAGLAQSFQYTSCAEDEAGSAREELEIDGITIPTPIKNFVAVAPFSWLDDTTFSTVLRVGNGFAILTATAIPKTFKFASDTADTDARPTNLPQFQLALIPIAKSDIATASFAGFYDSANHYQIRQYAGATPRVVGHWLLNHGQVVRQGGGAALDDPASPDLAREQTGQILADASALFTASRIPAASISSENVWCDSGTACGVLARQPHKNALPDVAFATKVPDICSPAQ